MALSLVQISLFLVCGVWFIDMVHCDAHKPQWGEDAENLPLTEQYPENNNEGCQVGFKPPIRRASFANNQGQDRYQTRNSKRYPVAPYTSRQIVYSPERSQDGRFYSFSDFLTR